MPRYQSAALREERATVLAQLQTIFTAAETETRELTAEDTVKASQLEARFAALGTEIRQLEIIEGYSPEQRAQEQHRIAHGEDPEARDARETASEEYRDAFMQVVRGEMDQRELRAAFSTAAGINGGNAVPQSWADNIREILVDTGAIYGLADRQTTNTGNPFNMPIIGTKSVATMRAEAAAISGSESEDTINTVQLAAYEIEQLVKASREFIRDGLNVDTWIQNRLGQNLSVKLGGLLCTGAGSGSSQPQGIFGIANTGKTAATSTNVAYADMVDLQFSVPGPYRNHPSTAWVVGDTTAAALMKLTDTTNRPLWIVTTQPGMPDTFLGKPIFTDPNPPTIGSSKKTVAFGAWSEYMVREVNDVDFQVLNELYSGNGQIGFIGRLYADANLLNFDAIKLLAHPA